MADKPKLYRLRFVANCSNDQAYFQKGEEHSFPKERARLFVKAGVAVEVDKAEEETPKPRSAPAPKEKPPKKRAWSKPRVSKAESSPESSPED
jgi:hypothetical protein